MRQIAATVLAAQMQQRARRMLRQDHLKKVIGVTLCRNCLQPGFSRNQGRVITHTKGELGQFDALGG